MLLALLATGSCDGADETAPGTTDTTGVGGAHGIVDDDGDGYSESEGDCDDANPDVNPDAEEVCDDGLDNDCDGAPDEQQPDVDGDGWGPCAGDCDETDPEVNSGIDEIPGNGKDDNCDGVTDPELVLSLGDEQSLLLAGSKLDLAIDLEGDLHMAYQRGASVFYKRQVDGTWDADEYAVQGADAATYSDRWYPNLAVDSFGGAHFVWG